MLSDFLSNILWIVLISWLLILVRALFRAFRVGIIHVISTELARYTIWEKLCCIPCYLFFILLSIVFIWAHFGLQRLNEKMDREGVTSQATIVEYFKERDSRRTYCRLRYEFEAVTHDEQGTAHHELVGDFGNVDCATEYKIRAIGSSITIRYLPDQPYVSTFRMTSKPLTREDYAMRLFLILGSFTIALFPLLNKNHKRRSAMFSR